MFQCNSHYQCCACTAAVLKCCGLVAHPPPPPRGGGNCHFVTAPPLGGNRHDIGGGGLQGGRKVLLPYLRLLPSHALASRAKTPNMQQSIPWIVCGTCCTALYVEHRSPTS